LGPTGAPGRKVFFAVTVIAAIPARFAAARLPGKPLAVLAGAPVIHHVVQRALAAQHIDAVVVATDHEEIARVASEAGAEAIMTDPDLPSGSDRIGAALEGREASLIVNLQGDEPELDPAMIDALIEAMETRPEAMIGTISVPLGPGELLDPNCVKVVCDPRGYAHYFSRAPIGTDRQGLLDGEPNPPSAARRHVGIYAYRGDALRQFLAAPPSELERMERLEQLRAMAVGLPIFVLSADGIPRGIDTQDDLDAARRRFEGKETP